MNLYVKPWVVLYKCMIHVCVLLHPTTANPPHPSHTTPFPSRNNHPCKLPAKMEPQWFSFHQVTPPPLYPT
jgi:hypothetical protein